MVPPQARAFCLPFPFSRVVSFHLSTASALSYLGCLLFPCPWMPLEPCYFPIFLAFAAELASLSLKAGVGDFHIFAFLFSVSLQCSVDGDHLGPGAWYLATILLLILSVIRHRLVSACQSTPEPRIRHFTLAAAGPISPPCYVTKGTPTLASPYLPSILSFYSPTLKRANEKYNTFEIQFLLPTGSRQQTHLLSGRYPV